MSKKIWSECPACGYWGLLKHALAACPVCGEEWLEARYDYASLRDIWAERIARRPFTIWRYWDLLPLHDPANILTMGEGGTPLLPAPNLGKMLGLSHIFIKDERQGPTGTLKDRQASLAISVMREQGTTEAVVASTGNVAIAYSAYAALGNIKLWAFLPNCVPADKLEALARYDTEVTSVPGTYDHAKQVAADFARQHRLHFDRGIKSLAAKESMKTVAFEMAEQLSGRLDFRKDGGSPPQVNPPVAAGQFPLLGAPHWYIQAVSGGLGPVGVWKGFKELYDLGLVDRLPKLACIQASGCAPMVNSFKKGLTQAEPVDHPQTVITTVATCQPGLAYTHLRQVILKYGGTFEAVSDAETFAAMKIVEELEGISMEPAAGLAFAGLFKMAEAGLIQPHEVVVVNCSGNTVAPRDSNQRRVKGLEQLDNFEQHS